MHLNTGWSKSKKVSPEDWAKSQAADRRKGFTQEAVHRFAQRHPERFIIQNGLPVGAVPRLKLALEMIREGKFLSEQPAHRGLAAREDSGDDRRIFDVEMPADASSPEPYIVKFLTDRDLLVIITVLPLGVERHKRNLASRKLQRKAHRIVDGVHEDFVAEKVELPPPVKCSNSLADVLRKAGISNVTA
jgi:hypothetical protein